MIYFTTLIFTLLLSHIARAVPACGNVASPQNIYDAYDDELVLVDTKVVLDTTGKYDNPNSKTSDTTCTNLAVKYPQFKNFVGFSNIGGSPNIKPGNLAHCGWCWKLTNKKTGKSIYFTTVDSHAHSFNLGTMAFRELSGGTETGPLDVDAVPIHSAPCPFK